MTQVFLRGKGRMPSSVLNVLSSQPSSKWPSISLLLSRTPWWNKQPLMRTSLQSIVLMVHWMAQNSALTFASVVSDIFTYFF